jgi:acylphosphatase
MSERVRRRVVVRGRVQGVWFRGATREQASLRGVAGFVRNRSDGSVEAAFEGPPDAVQALLDFVREGPRHAEVRDVEVLEEPPAGAQGFEIRY